MAWLGYSKARACSVIVPLLLVVAATLLQCNAAAVSAEERKAQILEDVYRMVAGQTKRSMGGRNAGMSSVSAMPATQTVIRHELTEFASTQEGEAAADCSEWQTAYHHLHPHAGNNAGSGPILIYRCLATDDCGGLADTISGVLATLVVALLTDRAFAIYWPAGLGVVDFPTEFICQWCHDDPSSVPDPVHIEATASLAVAQSSSAAPIPVWKDGRISLPRLRNAFKDQTTIVRWVNGQGIGHLVAKDQNIAKMLRERFGLSFDTLHYCVLPTLFRPSSRVRELAQPFLDQLRRAERSGCVAVSVHVRTGDRAFFREARDGLVPGIPVPLSFDEDVLYAAYDDYASTMPHTPRDYVKCGENMARVQTQNSTVRPVIVFSSDNIVLRDELRNERSDPHDVCRPIVAEGVPNHNGLQVHDRWRNGMELSSGRVHAGPPKLDYVAPNVTEALMTAMVDHVLLRQSRVHVSGVCSRFAVLAWLMSDVAQKGRGSAVDDARGGGLSIMYVPKHRTADGAANCQLWTLEQIFTFHRL